MTIGNPHGGSMLGRVPGESSCYAPNLVLIGMPGVGKSTLGVLAAKQLAAPFVDTDLIIQAAHGKRLQEIIREKGLAGFRAIEEAAVCSLTVFGTVIATGGSVVYSAKAMEHLRARGFIVWLDLSLPFLEQRLGDLDARGVVRAPGQSLQGLYEERQPLYALHAQAHLLLDGLNHEDALQALLHVLQTQKFSMGP
ncbi:shikimate kinase [Desulfosoma caldarium]|uniref:Shikimate kinase n=1 Tax=Desulfosoma caldarium TaxID=610254 RepID=A0A3N1UPY3_9BACT|nr:shikimate kinase [Desulfosoma caldarium]ROQ92123.1 shikimate kinase [Desulfosoma caldarium]